MKAVPALVISLALVVLFACSKDKFETKPRVEIKEYNTHDISRNGGLEIVLRYYDKEGDLGRAAFYAERIRTNLDTFTSIPKADKFPSALPDFPDRQDGEIIFRLDYNSLRENNDPNIIDSMIFKFAVMDRAGNPSDTITSDLVVVRGE